MNTPTAQIRLRHAGSTAAKPLRHRSEPPAARPLFQALHPTRADHDFLVPNPRPDLTMDPHTLRMLEAG
ncbi:MAG: hypothetical protein JNL92_02420 [Opitutaceae bacterium]|nr:hypothetical protein [Opitutaceae bacterium]